MQGCPHSVSRKGSEIRASSGQLAVSVFACAPLPSPRALAPPGSSSTAICSGFFWPHLHPGFSIPTTAAPKTPCAFFPKLVLSKISLCSTPQASVGRSGASAPPPPAHPSAPPQPLRPAPPLRGGPDLLRVFLPPSCCGAPPCAWLPGSRLQGYPATLPGCASSSRLPFLAVPVGRVEEGLGPPGEMVRASFSLVLALLVHPFVSFSGPAAAASRKKLPCSSCFVSFSPVSVSSSLSVFPYFFFFFFLSLHLSFSPSHFPSLGIFESLSIIGPLYPPLNSGFESETEKELPLLPPVEGPFPAPHLFRFWCYRALREDV